MAMDEAEYRKIVGNLFSSIANAFENVDPDVAECEYAMGSVTITLADRSRCILSTQPSVRQIWLALASRGTAYHFSWVSGQPADSASGEEGRWLDDKGHGIELISLLKSFLKEAAGLELAL